MNICRRKQETVSRLSGRLVFILSLLSLIDMGEPIFFDEPLEIALGKFQEMINQAVRRKKAEQSRDEIISTLLDEAKSLTNKEQLEIFKQKLQKAVEEADERKTEDKDKTEVALTQFTEMLPSISLNLQPVMELSKYDPLGKQLLHLFENGLGKVIEYFSQKKEVYTGEAEYAERKLNGKSKSLKTQLDLHAEL